MNSYVIEDIYIGMKEEFSVTITEDMQAFFWKITKDENPLHLDSYYAKKKGFSERIVYGMCTASFYSTLVGVYLPGEYCLFRECSVQFTKPVYINDTLRVIGKVIEIDKRFNCITIKALIINQNNDKVSRAKLADCRIIGW